MKPLNQAVKLKRTSVFNFKKNSLIIGALASATSVTTITTVPTYSKTCY